MSRRSRLQSAPAVKPSPLNTPPAQVQVVDKPAPDSTPARAVAPASAHRGGAFVRSYAADGSLRG